MDNESVAEHVPHDDQVRVLALHRNPVHAQKLREECTAMTLHYMLQDNTKHKESYSVSFNKWSLMFIQWHIVYNQLTNFE